MPSTAPGTDARDKEAAGARAWTPGLVLFASPTAAMPRPGQGSLFSPSNSSSSLLRKPRGQRAGLSHGRAKLLEGECGGKATRGVPSRPAGLQHPPEPLAYQSRGSVGHEVQSLLREAIVGPDLTLVCLSFLAVINGFDNNVYLTLLL